MKRRMLEITFQAIQRAQLPEKYSLAQETSSSITHIHLKFVIALDLKEGLGKFIP